MLLRELCDYTDALLGCALYRDYAPNGLQLEGKPQIQHIVGGVTANQALVDAAIAARADAVLVHHGWFWKNETPQITGIKKRRLQALMQHDIALLAYHLPLDAHPELGNNAQLATQFGWQILGRFGEQQLGCWGETSTADDLATWGQRFESTLLHRPLLVGEPQKPVRRIAWCTGAAQSYFAEAIDLGVDLFITGEISEPMVHLARETGVAYAACGHHATERGGVQALGQHLARHFGLTFQFVDIPSGV